MIRDDPNEGVFDPGSNSHIGVSSDRVTSRRNFLKKLKSESTRNLVGFWILGLCNNFPYVVMLSAAFDLLHPSFHGNAHSVSDASAANVTCNPTSTGAVLLADILPSLFVKLIAPFIAISTHSRVFIVALLSVASFLVTAFSTSNWTTFLGVSCAAFSSGLGEVTFLAYSAFFERNVISTWSSGTGGAGVGGALSYAALSYALSTRDTLKLMLIIPFIMIITFWFLIVHPQIGKCPCDCSYEMEPMLKESNGSVELSDKEHRKQRSHKLYSFIQKIILIGPLVKYMIPLGLVYFSEYFINQGLMELLYFKNVESWLPHDRQYKWYQLDYQVGVLISRSSINFFKIKRLWLLPILQVGNLIVLFMQVCFGFIPSIWIVLAIIFYEGLLGGSAYVNTFYTILSEVPRENREYSMSVASIADTIGIATAGFISLPVHDALCKMFPLQG